MKDKLLYNYLPIIGAICVVIGLFLGKFLYQDSNSTPIIFSGGSGGKVDEVIEQVVENYVDPINEGEITEFAVRKLLAHLDPHSTYIPPKDVEQEQERMSGKFEGIGIEFRIFDDTLYVINPIKGGPSQKAGVQSGDRIIGLNKQEIALGKLSTDSLVSLLRGKSGSLVELMVYRPFSDGVVNLNVTRGEIPIFSIDAATLLTDNIGFIKVNRFSSQTHIEFKEAARTLINKGARKLIIDLRDNPGGSLNSVVELCNSLLPGGKNIVYTKGENERETFNSTSDGEFMNRELAVLINQNSASASEILAGALQDNDKATIIGRRTFGKGLVQAVIPLKDRSSIHLTIARYYTPTGRCIQKPFEKDNLLNYHSEELTRWESGELYHEDSIKVNDSLVYKTPNGKTVYGGGGIIPDVFVGLDTTMNSPMLFELIGANLIRNFAIKFYTPEKIKGMDFEASSQSLSVEKIISSFKSFCLSNKIQWVEKDWKTSEEYITNKILANILRVKYNNNGFHKKSAELDKDIIKAIEVLN